jgi:hypothetical protein
MINFPSLLAAADRAALAHLGGAVHYVSASGSEADVVGVFDNADDNATVQGQEVVSSGPRVFLRISELPMDPAEETKGFPQVVVDSVIYSTRDVRKDGQGGVVLLLSEMA